MLFGLLALSFPHNDFTVNAVSATPIPVSPMEPTLYQRQHHQSNARFHESEIQQRFDNTWAQADVTLTASRF